MRTGSVLRFLGYCFNFYLFILYFFYFIYVISTPHVGLKLVAPRSRVTPSSEPARRPSRCRVVGKLGSL